MVEAVWPVLRDGGAAALGGWIAGLQRGACHCICEAAGGSPVLALLEKQLDRCGPEQLAPSVAGWSSAAVLSSFLLGLLLGAAAVASLARRSIVRVGGEAGKGASEEVDLRAESQRRLRALRSP
jgi:hypothetical protein